MVSISLVDSGVGVRVVSCMLDVLYRDWLNVVFFRSFCMF